MIITRRRLALLAAAAPLAAAAQRAEPSWPTKPLRIFVGFPAGSAPDNIVRSFSDALGQYLGQPVLIENRPGASGNIAVDLAAKSTDQHTFALPINGNLTTAKQLNPKLSYDPIKDLSFISLVASTPLVLITVNSLPGGKAFFEAAAASGDKWNYGATASGSVAHLAMELLQRDVPGMKATHVPFNGVQQIIAAMIGGQVQLALVPPGVAMAQVRAGRLRVVGVTGGRNALVPDVPPLSELGIHAHGLEGWVALVGPASLPAFIVNKTSSALTAVLRSDDIRQRIFNQGWRTLATSPEGLRLRVQEETAMFRTIINALGLKAE